MAIDRTGAQGPQPQDAPRANRVPPRSAEFERYFATRVHFGELAFSHDASQVAYIVNTSGQLNIWRQSVLGGWPWQVTTFEDRTARALLWSASGTIYGIADQSGTEQHQLFRVPEQGGTVEFLTDRPDAQYMLTTDGLAPDGSTLAYSGNDRALTDSDVLLLDTHTGTQRRVLANGRYNIPASWSTDGRLLSVVDVRGNTDLHLHVLDVATGESREVLPHSEPFTLYPGPWLPDGSGLYVITDRGREFKGIARYRFGSETLEWVQTPEWDVEQLALSRDGRRMLWVVNESGRSQLYLRDEVSRETMRVAGLPTGVIEQLRLSDDGETAVLRINAATAPADVYTITLGRIGTRETPRLRRLTYGMLGGLSPEELVEPEPVEYPTFDDRRIPAWLYRPPRAAAHQPVPVLVSIHGGPEAQERVGYQALYQYLLAHGIAVLAPNIRGSTGYGTSYQRLIYRDWGGGELRDIQYAAEWLRRQSWAIPSRLAVYGGSFGGFATLSAVSRLPKYWAAGVDVVGPSNLLTFTRSVPPTWRRMVAEWIGDPDADGGLLRQRSPITYVDQVRAPLLVIQGANDPRVVRAESDQMVERLRQDGREVEYVVFEDEGHGVTKRANRLRMYWLIAEFLLRHLL